MWSAILHLVAAEAFGRSAHSEDERNAVCRRGDSRTEECQVDGSGCRGSRVQLPKYELRVARWDPAAKVSVAAGRMSSYAIAGQNDTWQMYLHGPHFRASEQQGKEIPPVYVFGTWVNKVYKFEDISSSTGGSLDATLKVVGHALAPSTGWPVEDKSGRVKGLLVAEGQPFWIANDPHAPPMSLYKGGVSFLPAARENCTQIFPDSATFHKRFGQVTNTVDCHKELGICFFSVWKFYDDAFPFWDKISEYLANDCLYYCIANGLDSAPSCEEIAVLRDENGEPICHQDGVGAVHGFTIGKTDPLDSQKFDLLLVFTGELQFVGGESSMRKARLAGSTVCM
jgi:hypothetical protein